VLHETEAPDLLDVRRRLGEGVIWLDVVGLADTRQVQEIAGLFALHPLAIEDAVSHHQRSKTELYPDHLFITARMHQRGRTLNDTEQLSIFVAPGLLVTFQERPGDCLEPVRARLREAGGRVREAGADYLAYALLDALIDAYFPLVEGGEAELEALEDRLLSGDCDDSMLGVLTEIRHRETRLRRVLKDLRGAVHDLVRDDSVVQAETQPYLRDALDHLTRMVDQSESDRELAATLMDYQQSVVNQQMNEVMKVLTVMSTIFVPLGFLAGLWGMNFAKMPETQLTWGYPMALGLMGGIVFFTLRWFRGRGWF
jgi:magnesium transporter